MGFLVQVPRSLLMKIAIESSETLSDEELEQIVDVWNRKPRRIAV